jgi:chromosome condensin MukBEF MukE localization factor
MKIRDMISMPHPPFSLDLVSNNFYLFVTVKERLEHAGIMNDEELFEELHTILKAIHNEELENVFEA